MVFIHDVYKHVFGNAYMMESEQADLSVAESKFRRAFDVPELVGAFAKSEVYKKRFFKCTGPHKLIEISMKQFLGRAPSYQEEVSFHVMLPNEQGQEAEINSYATSSEYSAVFGEDVVQGSVFKG